MLAHLHTGEPAPLDYIKHIFYDRYKWTPDVLRAVPLPDLMRMLTVLNAEAKYHSRPRKPKQK